jgi:hypothetical protein
LRYVDNLFGYSRDEQVDKCAPLVHSVIQKDEKHRAKNQKQGYKVGIHERNFHRYRKDETPNYVHTAVKPQGFYKARHPTIDFRLQL